MLDLQCDAYCSNVLLEGSYVFLNIKQDVLLRGSVL